jgi:hypothetical protein
MTSLRCPEHLLKYQAQNGAFRSYMVYPDRWEEDQNGFVTALVLRALRRWPESATLSRMRERALDFLEQCASSRWAGGFGFWPERQRPSWAKNVPADLDDTAIMNLELLLHGRRTMVEARRVIFEVLVPQLRMRREQFDPPWIRPGVFPTWLTDNDRSANPIDCCVNANIIGLMAYTGLSHLPGYGEVCSMLREALLWARTSPARLASLTPYYPEPNELQLALENAVYSGATDLQPALRAVSALPTRFLNADGVRFLCSNAYGPPYWHSSAVHLARS